MKALVTQIKRSPYARNIATVFSGTALAQVIPIAVSPILTRLYDPSQFGTFALYAGLMSLLAIVATGRFELAITLPKRETESFSILVLSLIIVSSMSLVYVMLFFLFGREINSLLGIDRDNPLVYLVPLGVLTTAVYQVFSYWTIFRVRFKQLAAAKVAWSTGIATSQLALSAVSLKSGLLLGHMAGQVIAVTTLFFISIKRELWLRKQLSKKHLLFVLKKYRRFPFFSLPAGLTNNLSSHLPLILLGSYFGPAIVGLFALTQRVLSAPVSIFGVPILEVFKERASRDFRETGSCRDIYIKTLKSLVLLGIVPFIVLLLFAPMLFEFVFGDEWREAGEYARILSVLFLTRFVCSPMSYVLIISQKQRVDLIWQVVLLICTTSSILIGGLHSDPKLSVALYSASYSIMYLISLGLSYRFSEK